MLHIKRGCLERRCLWRAGIEASLLVSAPCLPLPRAPRSAFQPDVAPAPLCLLSPHFSLITPPPPPAAWQRGEEATLSLGARQTKPGKAAPGTPRAGEERGGSLSHKETPNSRLWQQSSSCSTARAGRGVGRGTRHRVHLGPSPAKSQIPSRYLVTK